MRHTIAVAAAACALSFTLAASARAGDPPIAAAAEGVTFTATAKITALDMKTRSITIEAEDGSTWSFKVDDKVQNLDKVKVGDVIVVKGFAAVAVALKGPKSGPAGAEVDEAFVKAAKGQMPAGAVVEQITLQGKIKAIDTKAPSVTFEGPGGKVTTVKAKDAKALQGLQVGDDVTVTLLEGLAIAVEHPAK
ncbi:hypothetical protein L6Q96_06520 [Candidatus Binatia bacterium]|nr:hypothetical protein [Candidatus Binatia bacterium]